MTYSVLQHLRTPVYHIVIDDMHRELSTDSNYTHYIDPKWSEKSDANSILFLVVVLLW